MHGFWCASREWKICEEFLKAFKLKDLNPSTFIATFNAMHEKYVEVCQNLDRLDCIVSFYCRRNSFSKETAVDVLAAVPR